MPDLHRRLPRRRDHRSGHASRRQPRHLHRLRRLYFRMPAGRDLQRRGRRRKMDQVQRRRIREGLIPFQTRKNQTPVSHIGGGFSYSQTFVIFRVVDFCVNAFCFGERPAFFQLFLGDVFDFFFDTGHQAFPLNEKSRLMKATGSWKLLS